ncbi:hypothetical protein ACJX0J_007059, partial [Zea mays]
VFNVVEEERNIENDGGTCCVVANMDVLHQPEMMDGVTQAVENLKKEWGQAQLPTFDEVQSGQATLNDELTYSLYALHVLLLHDINLGKYFIISLFHMFHLKSLFEGLIRYNVLLLRATCISDVVEYLQHMLDEFCSKEGAFEYVSHAATMDPKQSISRRTKEFTEYWFFVTGIYIILQNSIIL